MCIIACTHLLSLKSLDPIVSIVFWSSDQFDMCVLSSLELQEFFIEHCSMKKKLSTKKNEEYFYSMDHTVWFTRY